MGCYYEDFEPGTRIETPGRTITESDVVAFAQLTGDYNPLHTDFVYAQEQRFGQPIAHGLLGISYLLGLISRIQMFDGTAVALLGIDDWQFHRPIFFGDTVHGIVTITECRPSRDPRYGILYRRAQLINHKGEVVQEGFINIMMKRRPTSVEA